MPERHATVEEALDLLEQVVSDDELGEDDILCAAGDAIELSGLTDWCQIADLAREVYSAAIFEDRDSVEPHSLVDYAITGITAGVWECAIAAAAKATGVPLEELIDKIDELGAIAAP